MTGIDSKRQVALDKLFEVENELGLYYDEKSEQEPVAWGYRSKDGEIYDCISPEAHADAEGDYKVPLYTTPPKRLWVGLTDDEINNHYQNQEWLDGVIFAENLLKDKNT